MAANVSAVPRRRSELGLLVLVMILTAGAQALATLGKNAPVFTAQERLFLGAIGGLILAGHLAIRKFTPNADATLLPLAALLNGLGYVFIARLKPAFAPKQAMWTAVGLVAFVLTLSGAKKIKKLEYIRYTLLFSGLLLILTPLLPVIGYARNGSRIWTRIGPVTFQPGEVAKLILCIFFASYLVERRELLASTGRRILGITFPEAKHFGPLAIAWWLSIAIMVFQSDLGSSLLFFALFVSMLWVATGRGGYVVMTAVMFLAGSFASYQMFGHVQTRVQTWINPWPLASGKGYQIVQSLYAFGSGGIAGTGLGRGDPTRIPAAYNDFIMAAIGEELGLFGTIAVVIIFFLIVGAGLKIALRSESPFEKLLAVGLTTILSVQTFTIIGGVTRLVPLTGVTLPFVSYGGSSLVINYILIALLLAISNEANTRPEEFVALSQVERFRLRRATKRAASIGEDETSLDLLGPGVADSQTRGAAS